ncbi:MAG: CRISPR-associated endonuclease Cas2 [Nitrososphaerales archaeon]
MYVIIVYDIAIERINKVRQFLKRYLTWVQNSAFEGELTEGEIEKIKLELKSMIKEDEDSVIFFISSSKKWINKEVLGVEKAEISTII